MAEFTKETITTQSIRPNRTVSVEETSAPTTIVTPTVSDSQTVEYVIYFIFGIIDVLLGFRFVLKLLGASLNSQFTDFIYNLSGFLIWPFVGIFHKGFTQGIDATAVLEPATIVALIVYALLAWGIVKLLHILFREPQTE